MNGRVRPILLGSILLVLSLSSLMVFRALSSPSTPPYISRLMPALNYYEVNGDSQVSATVALGNGCLQPTSWGTPVQSENNFSVTAKVTDYSGPQISCTLAIVNVQYTYSLGQLAVGNYSFTFNACIDFPNYSGTVDCNNNRTTIFFEAGTSSPKPPLNDKIELAYQEVNGTSYVKASIVVPTCFRMRGWSDASQSGNSFRSNVTIVDDERLMIACIAIDTLAHNSYDLGHLAPGVYSFTLYLCKVVIGWGTRGTTDTNISTDCSNTSTIFFVVPGNPTPQPVPQPREWYMFFGPLAIFIVTVLRFLGIPIP